MARLRFSTLSSFSTLSFFEASDGTQTKSSLNYFCSFGRLSHPRYIGANYIRTLSQKEAICEKEEGQIVECEIEGIAILSNPVVRQR